jgi:hypothetical protein
MPALVLVLSLLMAGTGHAQKASIIDMLQLRLGQPFPIPPLMEAKDSEGSMPDYTITVPMPQSSPLNAFAEYDVDIMRDTKHIHVLRAKRTFESTDACARALKSLIEPIAKAYQVKTSRSDFSLFQAAAGDVEVEASCAFVAGSPYPTLNLSIHSKREKARYPELIRKRFAR